MFGSPRSLLVALLAFALALPSIVGCGTLAHAQETPPERPNVVFILADDLDKRLLTSHLSDYPNISRLAANGTTFSGAFVTNALCCPSRATMLTGQYSHNHGVMTNDPPEGGAPAFRPLEPKVQVGTLAPHKPAVPYARHTDLFPGEKTPQPRSFNEADVSDKPGYVSKLKPLTRDEIISFNELYRNRLRSMVAVDEMVGSLVATLRETGELSSTYVVFTSDNGVHAGQHRLREGKRLAYEEDIRVPLIVRGPGIPAGVTRSQMVLNNDLAPTFAEWAQANPLLPVDGRSLVPMLKPSPPSDSAWRTALLAEGAPHERIGRPAYRAVRTKNYLYVSYANGEKELYNLNRDPHQLRSYYPEADEALKDRLRGRLSSLASCAGAGCRSAEGQ